jgi:CheY-like chemotaxis protein
MAKRVLVADDNALIRRMLCELFEREEDYDICVRKPRTVKKRLIWP